MDLGVTNTNDRRVQPHGWQRRQEVGNRRQTRQEISEDSALVKLIHGNVTS